MNMKRCFNVSQMLFESLLTVAVSCIYIIPSASPVNPGKCNVSGRQRIASLLKFNRMLFVVLCRTSSWN